MITRTILLSALVALMLTTSGCKSPSTRAPEPLPFPNVNLPRARNADPSPQLDKSSVVISIPSPTTSYVGRMEISELNFALKLTSEIEKALKQAPQKTIYVQADSSLDYVSAVKAIHYARKTGTLEFALRVRMVGLGSGPDRQFVIRVLPEPDPETVSSKTNPSLLGVTLSPDSKIAVIKGGFEPHGSAGKEEEMGTVSDISRLTQSLTQILGDRTDRKVTIKAFKATRYDDVITIIDAVKGAGANPIVLQIDDLP